MMNYVNQNLFIRFEVKRGGTLVSHPQYADNTLSIGKATVDNLWSLMALLRVFEKELILFLNWLSGSSTFTEMTCNCMNCRK